MSRKRATDNAETTPRTLPPLWRRFQVDLNFVSRVYASVPADPEMIEAWINSRTPSVRPPGGKSIDELQEEVFTSLADAAGVTPTEYGMLVFQYADQAGERGIIARTDTLRAHVKDCSRQISAQFLGRVEGARAFSTRVINGLYQDPMQPWIAFRRHDGRWVDKPDAEIDRAVHGRFGAALKRLQILEPPVRLTWDFLVLGNSLDIKDLDRLFMYGGVHGYAGERSRDGGRYVHTLREITEGAA